MRLIFEIRNPCDKYRMDWWFQKWLRTGNPLLFCAFLLLCVPIRSVYVLSRFTIQNDKHFLRNIRSYTFCATLPVNLQISIRSITFRLRSYARLCANSTISLQSNTFLYVPCNPLTNFFTKLWNNIRSYTFCATPSRTS